MAAGKIFWIQKIQKPFGSERYTNLTDPRKIRKPFGSKRYEKLSEAKEWREAGGGASYKNKNRRKQSVHRHTKSGSKCLIGDESFTSVSDLDT